MDVANWDTNGDGRIDQTGVDGDGDGTVDVWKIDTNGDGVADQYGLDADNNGVPEGWVLDSNQDGITDGAAFDSDRNGVADTFALDANQNGRVERGFQDTNADGIFDVGVTDANENGVNDGLEQDPDDPFGDGKGFYTGNTIPPTTPSSFEVFAGPTDIPSPGPNPFLQPKPRDSDGDLIPDDQDPHKYEKDYTDSNRNGVDDPYDPNPTDDDPTKYDGNSRKFDDIEQDRY